MLLKNLITQNAPFFRVSSLLIENGVQVFWELIIREELQ